MASIPVLWPGEFRGQRSLAGYSPWGHKESDRAECLTYFGFSAVTFMCSNSRRDYEQTFFQLCPTSGTHGRLLNRTLVSGAVSQLSYPETQSDQYLRYSAIYNSFGLSAPPSLIAFISTF